MQVETTCWTASYFNCGSIWQTSLLLDIILMVACSIIVCFLIISCVNWSRERERLREELKAELLREQRERVNQADFGDSLLQTKTEILQQQPIQNLPHTELSIPDGPSQTNTQTSRVMATPSSQIVPSEIDAKMKMKRKKKRKGVAGGGEDSCVRLGDDSNEEYTYYYGTSNQYKPEQKRARSAKKTRERTEMEKMSSVESGGLKKTLMDAAGMKKTKSSSPQVFPLSSQTHTSSAETRESPPVTSSNQQSKEDYAQSRKASDRRNSGAGGSLPSLTAEAAMALVMANIDHHRKSLVQAIQASKSSNLVIQPSPSAVKPTLSNNGIPQSILGQGSSKNLKKSVQLMIPANNQPNLMMVAQPRDSQPDALLSIVRNTKVLVELAMEAVQDMDYPLDDPIMTNLKVVAHLHLKTIADAWTEMVHAAELTHLIQHSTAIEESCAIINEIHTTFNNYIMNKSIQNHVASLTATGVESSTKPKTNDVLNEEEEAEYYEMRKLKRLLKGQAI